MDVFDGDAELLGGGGGARALLGGGGARALLGGAVARGGGAEAGQQLGRSWRGLRREMGGAAVDFGSLTASVSSTSRHRDLKISRPALRGLD